MSDWRLAWADVRVEASPSLLSGGSRYLARWRATHGAAADRAKLSTGWRLPWVVEPENCTRKAATV